MICAPIVQRQDAQDNPSKLRSIRGLGNRGVRLSPRGPNPPSNDGTPSPRKEGSKSRVAVRINVGDGSVDNRGAGVNFRLAGVTRFERFGVPPTRLWEGA